MANELTSEHAKALSELGAAKGGHARAANLSPEKRSEIARRAAEARWSVEGAPAKIPRETHPGLLKIRNIELPCGVLEDGTRILSTRGINRALGSTTTGTPKGGKIGARQLPYILASDALKPYLNNELIARLMYPREYRPKHGGRTAFGHEATLLPEMCEVILDANNAGVLSEKRYGNIIRTADLLVRGFARVGIIALIDEATGYQEDRAKDELTRLLELYVQEAFRPYVGKFTNDFFRELYRIYSWEYKPGNTQSPRYVGKFINKYIYEPLLPNILPKLQEVNPTNKKGQRARKHFQHLSTQLGIPHVDKQIAVVSTLLRLANTPQDFDDLYQRACGKEYQHKLNFPDPEPLVIDVDMEEGKVN